MVAQALCTAPDDVVAFTRNFSWRLRWWLLGMPAGIGKATLRAVLKLWLGLGPNRSGVFSAGNGPAMRSAVLGVAFPEIAKLQAFNHASTHLTHTDPKAEQGALAARMSAREEIDGEKYLEQLRSILAGQGQELLTLIVQAQASAARQESTLVFADSLGLQRGVTGYMLHTAPVVLHAWLRHPRDYRAAVQAVIACGGDTDTTAAIVGAIVGAAVGKEGIPAEWLQALAEWPRSVAWMEKLGHCLLEALSTGKPVAPPRFSLAGLMLRNGWFFLVVLAHVLRRCLPPY
jgi:ADP-ribosylglycohydrolase